MFLSPISIILSILCITYAKIYDRCELARELRNFDLPEVEIPTWVCIAEHESNYDTSAMNYGSGDHGLFQISQLFWCSPPGNGYGCNSPCSKFRDDDISDDLQCIRRIHNEHTRISGDGFNAWVVYPLYCKNDNSIYVQGCFDQEYPIAHETPANTTDNEIPIEEVDEYGDGYQFPSLPNFSKNYLKNEETSSEPLHFGDDGYEFPKLPFSRISIHESTPVKDDKYNFPNFPFSKQSIHDFISVHMPLEKEISSKNNQAKQDENTVFARPTYDKHSIHHFVPVSSSAQERLTNEVKLLNEDESEYSFPPLPKVSDSSFEQRTPQNIPAPSPSETQALNTNKVAKYDVEAFNLKPSYSKQSIHHFVPVSETPENSYTNGNKKIHKENSESASALISQDTTMTTIAESKPILSNEISKAQEKASDYIHVESSSKFPMSSKSFAKSSSSRTTTYKPTIYSDRTRPKLNNSTPQKSGIITDFETSTTKIARSTSVPLREPTNEPFKKMETTTQNVFTTALKPLDVVSKYHSTTRGKSFVFTKKLINTSQPTSPTISLFSTVTSKPISSRRPPLYSSTTTSKPLTTKSILNRFASGPKQLDNVLKSSATLKSRTHPLIKDQSLTKDDLEDYDLQGASSTLTPFTASKSRTTIFKPFLTKNYVSTTISKPYTTKKTSFQYLNPQTTLKSFTTTTSRPVTTQKTSFGHFKSHSTTVKSLRSFTNFTTTSKPITSHKTLFTTFKPQTTTSKPSSTYKLSSRTTFKVFPTQPTTVEPAVQRLQTSSTKKTVLPQVFTTLRPSYNFTYHPFSTSVSKQFYTSTTTSKPLAKQLTFAPDSFFSWLTGSQTLPPLVPPARPPRPQRPGDRPGPSTLRPQRPSRPGGLPPPINQRPGGLPRPPRPRFPGGKRPSMAFDGLTEPQDLSGKTIGAEIQPTKMPIGPSRYSISPNISKSSSEVKKVEPFRMTTSTKTSVQKQNTETSTIKSLRSFTTTSLKHVALKEDVFSRKQDPAIGSSRQFSGGISGNKLSTIKKLPHTSGGSKFEQNGDEQAVEVKIDDNFVFLRTRFGYRLFRNTNN